MATPLRLVALSFLCQVCLSFSRVRRLLLIVQRRRSGMDVLILNDLPGDAMRRWASGRAVVLRMAPASRRPLRASIADAKGTLAAGGAGAASHCSSPRRGTLKTPRRAAASGVFLLILPVVISHRPLRGRFCSTVARVPARVKCTPRAAPLRSPVRRRYVSFSPRKVPTRDKSTNEEGCQHEHTKRQRQNRHEGTL